ncbi:MAG: phosphoenolpyruvate--protein phosphotransferase [Lachnospiraceae bacterium]|nr:phosphoenolpyruvate--protein phosphotransferase [Lachnospiraceae bacterium]
MIRIIGKTAAEGYARATVGFYGRKKVSIPTALLTPEEVESHVQRFTEAVEKAAEETEQIYQRTLKRLGHEQAAIFEGHKMILEDVLFREKVETLIRNDRQNVMQAVKTARDDMAIQFEAMTDNPYLQAKAEDVRDIADRLLFILAGKKERNLLPDQPLILMAKALTPSETLDLDPEQIRGIVTTFGSSQSHAAILARSMGIPAITGVIPDPSYEGKEALMLCEERGQDAVLLLDPTEEDIADFTEKQRAATDYLHSLQDLKNQADETKDGRSIMLYANVSGPQDAQAALENGAKGIGLYRTEFLFLRSHTLPTEEEQFEAYKQAALEMEGRDVVIRTLDLGADKQLESLSLPREENPAMGYRAIRICLNRPDIFKPQLRAILRAALYGSVKVMYPMITSMLELSRIHEVMDQVKAELRAEGIPFGEVQEGAMIETPAAALISDQIAKEVSFLSIGTNDLTQYTLAIDRQNENLDNYYDPHHEAVLKLIRLTVENAHKAGCHVGICGELASDTSLTKAFLEMGVDELSVSPRNILKLRSVIRGI